MKNAVTILILILAISTVSLFSQAAPQSKAKEPVPQQVVLWKYLKPGPFTVGFGVMQKYDYTRTIFPKYDFAGNPNSENARPIQICGWYPAQAQESPVYMKYGEYAFLNQSEMDFEEPPQKEKAALLEQLAAIAIRLGGDPQKVARVYTETTIAIQKAKPHEGKFPLILYVPGRNDSAYVGAIMAEYLASHGYVVVSASSVGRFRSKSQRGMTPDFVGIDTQVEDMAFIISALRSFPNVDWTRIGTIGFKWGGLSNVILALKNHNIDAVVSLDGAIGASANLEGLKKHPYFAPIRMRAPFMHFLPKESQQAPHDLEFFNTIRYADALTARFNRLLSNDFSDSYILQYLQYQDKKTLTKNYGNAVDLKNIFQDYSLVCRYVLRFFDAYLRKDEREKVYLARAPRETGIPENVMNLQFKKGLAPPSEAEFFALAQTRGIEKMRSVFDEVKKREPKLRFFRETAMNTLGRYYLEQKKVAEAIQSFKMNVEAYPDSWHALYSLAAAYELAKMNKEALQYYQKALPMIPTKSTQGEQAIKEVKQRIKRLGK